MSNSNQHKPGYKHTSLGWIPEEWDVLTLRDVCDKIQDGNYGGDYPTSDEFCSYGVPFLTSKALGGDGTIIKHKIDFISQEKHLRLKKAQLKIHDILFTNRGANLGVIGVVNESIANGNIGPQLTLLRASSNKVHFHFLKEAMKSFVVQNQVRSQDSGSAMNFFGIGETAKFKLIIPPPIEQQKIAAILSTWDEAITKTQQLISQLQQRNKGLMHQLLTYKKRLKGFEDEWKEIVLSECLSYTPREVPKPAKRFFALGIRSHAKGIFHKNDFEPGDLAMEFLYEVKENDLIVNITFAWEQAIAIAGKKDCGGLVSHRFPTYTFIKENAEVEFFRYLIIQKSFKYLLDLISPGGAGRNRVMSKKEFLKLKVTIPDVKEQKAIANILNAASAELKIQDQKLAALQLQKKGLMQKLLTGEVRVKIDNNQN